MFGTHCLFLYILLSPNIAYSMRDLTAKDRENARQMGIDPKELGEHGHLYNGENANITYDDHGMPRMPEKYRCDGCYAIAFQLQKQFKAAEKRYKKKGARLGEVDILDVFEKVCNDKFKSYGVKHNDGSRAFSGDGLLTDMLPGVLELHQIWRVRLQGICEEVSGMYDEERIYQWYTESKESEADNTPLRQLMCRDYCYGASALDDYEQTEL